MKIAVSLLSFRPGRVGGAETYIRQLLAHLAEVKGDDSLVLVAFRDNADAVRLPGVEKAVIPRSDWQTILARMAEAFTPWRDRSMERVFRDVGADVAFFPQQSIYPKAVGTPCVLTVVDVQHLFFPRRFSLFDRAFRAAIYPRSMRRADRIMAISEHTRNGLVSHCGVPPARVTVVPPGLPDKPPEFRGPHPLVPGRYLYYPAATFPHKNHETLLRAFAELKRRRLYDGRLVLTGQQTARWGRLRRLIRTLGIESAVRHLGFVPYSEVGQLYAGADAVVFPSRYEGFGIPVAEAVRFGKKVICSRLEVFDEIGVPARFQIDFGRPDELVAALALEGPTVLEKPLPTWPQAARATLDLLRQAAASNPTFGNSQQERRSRL
jgi:glycosyltransferase involved in cell wall biosynthesis